MIRMGGPGTEVRPTVGSPGRPASEDQMRDPHDRRPFRRTTIAGVGLVLGITGAACDGGFAGPVTGEGVDGIDAEVTSYIDSEALLGAALAIVVDGRLVHARGYGFADLARTEPVQPDHLFRVASVSKSITGIGVLEAVEQGLLDLDDPVTGHLTALLPPAGPADARVSSMTVAHLLHHSAGWMHVGSPDHPAFRMKEIAGEFGVPSPPDGESLVRWLLTEQLGFAPGADYLYSNIGYVMLARVIEGASGVDYEAFIREQVLAPAGVTRARIGGIRQADRLDGEVEYDAPPLDGWESIFDGETGLAPNPAYGGINITGFDGSAGWVVSMVDLARLGVAVDGHATVPDILSADLQRTMTSDGVPGPRAYGAGFFLASASVASGLGLDAIAFVAHSGAMPGTSADLHIREDGLIVAIAMNTNRTEFDDFTVRLLQVVNAVDQWPTGDLFSTYR